MQLRIEDDDSKTINNGFLLQWQSSGTKSKSKGQKTQRNYMMIQQQRCIRKNINMYKMKHCKKQNQKTYHNKWKCLHCQ